MHIIIIIAGGHGERGVIQRDEMPTKHATRRLEQIMCEVVIVVVVVVVVVGLVSSVLHRLLRQSKLARTDSLTFQLLMSGSRHTS